jgi:hypothetical protein
MSQKWSKWRLFPDPRKRELLTAPIGPGCYALCDGEQLVLYGMGNHVALRMTSLLPSPHGSGTRNNFGKRQYVVHRLGSIKYRTLACGTAEEAKKRELKLKANREAYKFQT